MFKKNDVKMTNTQIESSPGFLSAQIVFNSIIENDFKIWMIGNVAGNSLFTVTMTNDSRSIVSFTTKEIALSYANRKDILNIMMKTFGKKAVLVNMHILRLYSIINSNPFNNNQMESMIVNPTTKEFFVPINFKSIAERLENTEQEINAFEEDMEDVAFRITYDKELKRYIEDDTIDKISG